jgi:hypothetical protein
MYNVLNLGRGAGADGWDDPDILQPGPHCGKGPGEGGGGGGHALWGAGVEAAEETSADADSLEVEFVDDAERMHMYRLSY